MKTAIVIVQHNMPKALPYQLRRVWKFIKPDAVYVVETTFEQTDVKELCGKYNANYCKMAMKGDFSQCHAAALNFAYSRIKDKYDVVGFLDHDCFPIKEFDIAEEIGGYDFLAINQKGVDVYPHPGYLFVRTSVGDLDFMPNAGNDTGGSIAPKFANVKEMSYIAYENGTELIGGALWHWVKGSNWNNDEANAQRIAMLYKHLSGY